MWPQSLRRVNAGRMTARECDRGAVAAIPLSCGAIGFTFGDCLHHHFRGNFMTKDLALACGKKEREAWVTTQQFMQAIEKRFKKNLEAEGIAK